MVRKIPLTQGKFTLVDEEDYEELYKYKWYYHNGYAARSQYNPITQKAPIVLMHRVIMNVKEGEEVDHINHNTLNNRKCNLRVCTSAQNNQNRQFYKTGTSYYKGVSWNTNKEKWIAQIIYNGKSIYLGTYTDEEQAARAYDKKAIEVHGEFAYTNFPR